MARNTIQLVHYVSVDGEPKPICCGMHSEYIVLLEHDKAENYMYKGFGVETVSEIEVNSSILPTDRILVTM